MHRQSGIAYAAQLGFSYVHIGDMIEQVVQFKKLAYPGGTLRGRRHQRANKKRSNSNCGFAVANAPKRLRATTANPSQRLGACSAMSWRLSDCSLDGP
jgi:hypothetical protein